MTQFQNGRFQWYSDHQTTAPTATGAQRRRDDFGAGPDDGSVGVLVAACSLALETSSIVNRR
jgi:hypothetical protein